MNTIGKYHAVPSPIKACRWAKSALNFIFCFLHSTGTHTCLNGDGDDVDDYDDNDDNGDDEVPLIILCRVCEGSNSHFLLFVTSDTATNLTHFLRNIYVSVLCHLGYAWYE